MTGRTLCYKQSKKTTAHNVLQWCCNSVYTLYTDMLGLTSIYNVKHIHNPSYKYTFSEIHLHINSSCIICSHPARLSTMDDEYQDLIEKVVSGSNLLEDDIDSMQELLENHPEIARVLECHRFDVSARPRLRKHAKSRTNSRSYPVL